MFYCGRVAFTVFKHADIKGVKQRLTSTASLDDGYYEATIPVGSRFEYICAFYVEITNIHGAWKCHVILVIKTDLSGFVVQTVRQISRANAWYRKYQYRSSWKIRSSRSPDMQEIFDQ